MRNCVLFCLSVYFSVFSAQVLSQGMMPQGIFVQTCSPPFGEKYIFEGQLFSYYSTDLLYFGKGTYKLRKNLLQLNFDRYGPFPHYVLNETDEEGHPGKSVFFRLFGPGKSPNQVTVWVEVFDSLNHLTPVKAYQTKDSISIDLTNLSPGGAIRIRHPEEGTIEFSSDNLMACNSVIDVFFQNGWEQVEAGTMKKTMVQDIRVSSFMLEKTIVRKRFYCVFIREDQALRLLGTDRNKPSGQ